MNFGNDIWGSTRPRVLVMAPSPSRTFPDRYYEHEHDQY